MNGALAQIQARIGRRGIAAALLLLAVLLAVVATPQLLGARVADALQTLRTAEAEWLWLAGVGFAVSVLAAAGSWRCAIGLCGGRLPVTDACARYGAGSFVNTFVPFRAGDAVRIGLFARALPNRERLWTMGGAFAALGAARAVVLGMLVVAGALAGVVPLWPLLVAAGLVAVGVAATVAARRSGAHLLDAFRELGRDRTAAARLVAWIGLSTLGRLAAATAVAAALGISHPLAAAVVIVPALDIASLLPVTPGNIGVTSAAVAMALQAHGASFTNGLAAGIAFHAVETAVGIMFGVASLVWLAPYPTPAARRIALLAGAGSWALGVAGAFGATVLAPLV
ncbi:MAG TPA: lysylphosphatidylglycerol synthase domain-containing protein [Gaiellaceae bacterium]|nr:lysylphosphatidylglycerol synthase domain-containing protein [Gaiellaceae bacterium]